MGSGYKSKMYADNTITAGAIPGDLGGDVDRRPKYHPRCRKQRPEPRLLQFFVNWKPRGHPFLTDRLF